MFRVISNEGEQLGMLTFIDALEKAYEDGVEEDESLVKALLHVGPFYTNVGFRHNSSLEDRRTAPRLYYFSTKVRKNQERKTDFLCLPSIYIRYNLDFDNTECREHRRDENHEDANRRDVADNHREEATPLELARDLNLVDDCLRLDEEGDETH